MSNFDGAIGFVKGVLWGAAIGVGAGLLMAPASGAETRDRLRERSEELREQAMHTAEAAKAKVEALQERGREVITENAARLTRTAEAVRRTAQETWQEPVPPEPTDGGRVKPAMAGKPA